MVPASAGLLIDRFEVATAGDRRGEPFFWQAFIQSGSLVLSTADTLEHEVAAEYHCGR